MKRWLMGDSPAVCCRHAVDVDAVYDAVDVVRDDNDVIIRMMMIRIIIKAMPLFVSAFFCVKKNKTRNYFESLFVQGINF